MHLRNLYIKPRPLKRTLTKKKSRTWKRI